MCYEPRIIDLEIARDNEPVWLVAPDVFTQIEVQSRPGEKFANANRAVVLPPVLRKLAIIDFSGRYDIHQTVSGNLAKPRDIYFVEAKDIPTHGPAKIIFKSSDQSLNQAVTKPGVSFGYIRNILGDPLFTVASLPASN
jgi:hypothetical protein